MGCKFPLIPLARGSKCPIVKGWHKDTFPITAFGSGNIGTRAGEWVSIDGKEGFLFIIDYDSTDLELFRKLCIEIKLPPTTCVRTGGGHNGYHLYYLTDFEVRKHGMLSYREAPIDLLGKGSFAVIPPSIVEKPYKYISGLDKLSYLTADRHESLLILLTQWKNINNLIKKVKNNKVTYLKAEETVRSYINAEMMSYFNSKVDGSFGMGLFNTKEFTLSS